MTRRQVLLMGSYLIGMASLLLQAVPEVANKPETAFAGIGKAWRASPTF